MTDPKRCLSKETVLNLLKMNPNDPRMRAFCSRHIILDSNIPDSSNNSNSSDNSNNSNNSDLNNDSNNSDSESEPEDGYESDFNEEWKWEWITEEDSDNEESDHLIW